MSEAEVESLRFHLGYGQVQGVGANAYTPDGFYEIFHQVVAPNLTGDTETTGTTTISAGSATVTVASMTGIAVHARLVVDVGDAAEIVAVRATGASSFTAVFANDHAQPYPVAVMGGQARLRLLLHRADALWQAKQSSDISDTAGIEEIVGDVKFFEGNILKAREKAYEKVVGELMWLCQVKPRRGDCRTGQLEAY
ncbi:MAG TPA: hypothetical protein VGK73_25240 [Polyangiaceae bacterium]